MNKNLFVYGTLGPERPNEHILKNIGGTFKVASVTGTLYNKGWGAELGFPGIKLDTNGTKVEGFLFNSDNINEHWSTLDEFEGEAYERVLTKVTLESKAIVEAFIYILRK